MDVDKHENDDELTLVLELPETDPLFGKKVSCTPDQLNDFLDVLVQRARIINFNEVELYFGGDIINLRDSISPRNELEALHSILEVIDKSRSGEKYTMKTIQQKLQEEIVDRIDKVGMKFSEETKIVGDVSCDKEKGLLDWGVDNGVKTKLDIAYVEGAGRGAIAKEDLKVGDIALEIPVSVIISEELLYESDMFSIFEKIDGISEETMLLLWSMKEKHNKKSKFKLYFDTLPERFNTGLSFGIDAVMSLDGTLLLEEVVQAKEYDELFPTLSDRNPDVFPPELYTWEQFLWACELWYSNCMKVIFSDGKLRTCLIPVAGFLNHSICPHIIHYGRIDATTNSLKFPLSRACRSGEQCFLSYGNFSSSHALTFYGFLPQGDNPYDVIPLDIDVAQDEDSGNSQISVKTQELLETDIDVLRDLSATFEGMMEALGDENPEDREKASWDVKLAIEFRNSQRRIISSILTSCNAGCELLESELRKYTAKLLLLIYLLLMWNNFNVGNKEFESFDAGDLQ
ncbi:hypothetical protein DH2020_039174 [Rehmannia glutinosa]|uniref:SET domain-containing protein n=1 Tax=Rehmannia glutinosa TaxID=99300 RepID=A0ABR0UYE7_REHGL